MSRLVALTTLSLVVLLVGCTAPAGGGSGGGGNGDRPAVRKRIVAAILGDPATLSDAINQAGAGGTPGVAELERMVNAGLVYDGKDSALLPQLAEAVPNTDNGLWRVFSDGRMETTYKIRPGARWQDGAPFTSQDVAFTVQVGLDKEVGLLNEVAFELIERVETPDPQTVRVLWNKPYIDADTLFSYARGIPIPKHLLERPFVEERAAFTQHPYWIQEFVGTGPFKVRVWERNSHIVLDAFDQYALGRPKLDELEVRFIPDPNTLVANFLAGTVELNVGRRFSLEMGLQIRDQWKDGRMDLAVSSGGGGISLFPQFLNPDPPILLNAQTRRALLHATDRQELVDTLQAGMALVSHSMIAADTREYPDIQQRIVRYEFDSRRAGQLIEGLGYMRGADGVFVDGTGRRLATEIRTTIGDDLRNKMLLAIADQWQRVGVPTETVLIPQQRAQDREYRANRPGFEMVRQPADWRRFYGPESALPQNEYRGLNRTRYANPEFDALIERYYVTIPWRERMDLLGQMIHHMTDQLVIMTLMDDVTPTMVGNRLVNVGAPRPLANVHEWDAR